MKWISIIEKDLTKLDDFITEYEKHLDDAKKDIEIGSNIINEARKLPQIVDFNYGKFQEVQAIYEIFDIELKKVRSRWHRHYLTNFAQKLTSRDVERFVDGEPEVVDVMIQKNRVNLLRDKFASITKGLEYKHYQITNIVKLKAAGIDDYI